MVISSQISHEKLWFSIASLPEGTPHGILQIHRKNSLEKETPRGLNSHLQPKFQPERLENQKHEVPELSWAICHENVSTCTLWLFDKAIEHGHRNLVRFSLKMVDLSIYFRIVLLLFTRGCLPWFFLSSMHDPLEEFPSKNSVARRR